MTKYLLIFSVLSVLFSGGVKASAGAMVIINQSINNGTEDTGTQIVEPLVKSDGFIYAREYYFEGPHIKICFEVPGKNIVAHENKCALKQTTKLPFFSLSWSGREESYVDAGNGISVQEYLDNKFGPGIVTFAAVSPRTSKLHRSIVIFYTINN